MDADGRKVIDGNEGSGEGGGEAVPPPQRNLALRVAWEWTRSLAIAFILFVTIRAVGVEAFKIPTSSMERTLLVGDFLLVNKGIYGAQIPGTELRLPAFAEPSRGEVIVFNPPHEPSKNYVKRLVGMPGDTLEMRDKVLYVNGRPLEEPYAKHIDNAGDAVHPGMTWQRGHLVASPMAGRYQPSRDTWGPLGVPEGSYFVLGDNRDNSEDSRYWGFVDRDAIRGRPWVVYYSYDRAESEPVPWVNSVRWSRVGWVIR